MRPIAIPLLAIGAGLLLAAPAAANPYASQLAASTNQFDPAASETVDISFYLNEAADSVIVEIFGPAPDTDTVRSIDLGALAAGAHSAEWDGTDDGDVELPMGGFYSFRVVTESDGHAEWTNITSLDGGDPVSSSLYPHPAGIAVIRDMNSPFFGLVGVANTRPPDETTEAGLFDAENQGLYILNGDLTWFGGSATAAFDAALNDPAAPWDDEDNFSPWLLKAGRNDGMFYLGDWGTEGDTDAVYRYDLVNQAVQVLSPGVGTHGRVISATTTGTGPGTVLWGMDRDGDDEARAELYRWNIGNAAPFTGEPERIVASTGWGDDPLVATSTLHSMFDFAVDDDGNLYLPNRRWAGADTRLTKFDSDGNTIWSLTGTELEADGYPATAGDGVYLRSLACHDGKLYGLDDFIKIIAVFDVEDGSLLDSFPYTDTETTLAGRAVAVDAAGNVYVSDQDAQAISVWSPPGENSFTSTYGQSLLIGDMTSIPATAWEAYE